MNRILLVLALTCCCGTAPAYDIQNLAEIEQSVRDFVHQQGLDSGDAELRIGRLDPRLRLARCGQALDTRFTRSARPSGPVSVEVRCNSNKPWSLYVPVTIDRFAKVVVTARPIGRGHRVTEDDLRIERRRIDTVNNDYLDSAMPAVGLIAGRQLRAGEVISARHLERPRLIRRGQQVTLTSGSSAVSVSVKGQALADGSVGERIRVRNLGSERVVEGTVSPTGAVIVAPGVMM